MYSSIARRRRLRKALGIAVAAAAMGAPVAHGDEFVPGVTDFPSRVQPTPEFVPGVTDFPSRLGAKAEQAARVRVARAAPVQSPSGVSAGSDFDWGAAGIGAGVGVGGMLLAALAIRARPRTRVVRPT